jgi:hypothetical protein
VYDISNDNNLVQFEAGILAVWGLRDNQMIRELTMDGVSQVHASFDGKKYYIGFENGDL